MNKSRSICAAGVLALLSTSALAIPISYNGGVFDLTGSLVSGTTYDITYSADLTNFGDNGQYFIDSLAFKVPGGDIVNSSTPSLLSGPGGGDPILTNGLASGGCKNANTSKNWVCLTLTEDQPTMGSPLYEWIFQATFTDLVSTFDGSSIKMRFVDSFGSTDKVGALLSCETNGQDQEVCSSISVPEPATLSLLGLGLLGMGAAIRRRKV